MSVNFNDHSPEVLAAMERAKKNALVAIGMTAEAHAKETITRAKAVQTGRLRGSISYAPKNPTEDYVCVGTNVEYALGIEIGTHRKAGAVHFLQDAAANHSSEYKALATEAMKNA